MRGEQGGSGEAPTLVGRIRRWYEDAEEVWADIGGKEGEQRQKMLGRAKGPRFVWKCALGPLADPTLLSTKAARSWRKLEGWCNAIKLALTHRRARECKKHPLWAAARVARKKIASANKWCIGDEADTRELMEFSCAAKAARWDEVDQVVAMAAWAQGEAVSVEGKALRKERARYSEWLRSGPMGGLARQHAATKSVGQWLPSKMVKLPRHEGEGDGEGIEMRPVRGCTAAVIEADGDVVAPADIQQEADMETRSWAAQWDAGGEAASVEWPRDIASLSPITVQELKDAEAQFKRGAGLGWDRMHPRALLRLPDRLLGELCNVLREAEAAGDWTEAIGVVMIALLAKSDWGWRPIGLLPSS